MDSKDQKNAKKENPEPKLKTKQPNDELAFTVVNVFKSPAFFFTLLMIPVCLGVVYAFTAKPADPNKKREIVVRVESPKRDDMGQATIAPSGVIRMTKSGHNSSSYEQAPIPGGQPIPKSGCALNFLVGKPIAGNVAVNLKASDRPYRRLPPGSAMTMDYSKERINVETDDKGIIRRVWCG